jgi:hypothetical protein
MKSKGDERFVYITKSVPKLCITYGTTLKYARFASKKWNFFLNDEKSAKLVNIIKPDLLYPTLCHSLTNAALLIWVFSQLGLSRYIQYIINLTGRQLYRDGRGNVAWFSVLISIKSILKK